MKQRYLKLTVEPDGDLEDPCDGDGWKLYSFNRRHCHFKEPEEIGLCPDKPEAEDKTLKQKLKKGFAFFLAYYEHGACLWMLRDVGDVPAGVEFQWDGVHTAGLLVWEQPNEHLGQKKWTYKDRAKDAECFLKTYNAWANGEGTYFRLETGMDEDLDGCGGFYSIEDAMAAVEEAIPDGYKGVPIVVEGTLADTVMEYHKLEGHEYVDEDDLEDVPEPEYSI